MLGLPRISAVNDEASRLRRLQPDASYAEFQAARASVGQVVIREDEIMAAYGDRADEVSDEERDRAQARRDALLGRDGRVESYRTIRLDDAIRMLHIGAAPPRRESVPEQMEAVLAGE